MNNNLEDFKDWAISCSLFSLIFYQFSHKIQCYLILFYAAISTPLMIFLNYGTLLSPESEQLTLPESTEGLSPLLVCTSILGFKRFHLFITIAPQA
jgi:hypothetical protein